MIRHHTLVACLLFGGAFAPANAHAQIRASERGSVSQTIDGTQITIDYGRPQARGRTGLFGGEVPWGKVWTPGANWATTLEVSRDVTIDGHAVPAGTYSVWFEVGPETWTAILDPTPRRFHLMPPPADADGQIRFAVQPTAAEHTETLTWSFPRVAPTGGTVSMAWADRQVSLDVAVEPSRPVTVAPDVAARYVGTYRLQHGPALGGGEAIFEIRYEHERLVAHWEGVPNPHLRDIWLISLGEGMFAPALLQNGELFDIVMDLVLEFTPLEGEATRFELRALGDALWGTAERTAEAGS